MMGEIQHANFYTRQTSAFHAGIRIDLGGGEGNLVKIHAVHHHLELFFEQAGIDLLIMSGLSENPELFPAGLDFNDFPPSPDIYGKATWWVNENTTPPGAIFGQTQVIPCYGVVRPRKQVWVMAVLNGSALTGIWIEVWYEPHEEPSKTIRDEINRKFGKYRRT